MTNAQKKNFDFETYIYIYMMQVARYFGGDRKDLEYLN